MDVGSSTKYQVRLRHGKPDNLPPSYIEILGPNGEVSNIIEMNSVKVLEALQEIDENVPSFVVADVAFYVGRALADPSVLPISIIVVGERGDE